MNNKSDQVDKILSPVRPDESIRMINCSNEVAQFIWFVPS